MKFTKEDAYKELVAKLTATGETLNLSERSINEQIENLLPLVANDETELSDFVEKVFPFIKTADSNVRKDVSNGINEYKKNNPPQEPKKTEPKKTEPKGEPTELEKRLAAMEAKLAEAEEKERTANVRSELISKLKEKGVKNEKWIKALMEDITISEDFNVEDKAEKYLKLYNDMNSDTPLNVTPGSTSTGKHDILGDAIKQAATFAKSQNLIE